MMGSQCEMRFLSVCRTMSWFSTVWRRFLGGCAWGVEGVVECGCPEALLVAGAGEVPPEPEVEGGYDFSGPGIVWSVSGSSGGFGDCFFGVGVEPVMLRPVGFVEPGFWSSPRVLDTWFMRPCDGSNCPPIRLVAVVRWWSEAGGGCTRLRSTIGSIGGRGGGFGSCSG